MRRRILSRSKGFTLIEALVALLVLSLGLLGVAAMQFKALQGAHAGYQRSIASLAAQDAQERLWARLDDGTCPDWSTANQLGKFGWDEAFDAGEDYRPWDYYLPGHSAESNVVSDATTDECEFTITVTWGEDRFADEGNPEFIYIVRLPGEVLP